MAIRHLLKSMALLWAIGVGALGLSIWAWRRPDDNRSLSMIAGLALISTAIIVQGWFGGAMVHGVDHINW